MSHIGREGARGHNCSRLNSPSWDHTQVHAAPCLAWSPPSSCSSCQSPGGGGGCWGDSWDSWGCREGVGRSDAAQAEVTSQTWEFSTEKIEQLVDMERRHDYNILSNLISKKIKKTLLKLKVGLTGEDKNHHHHHHSSSFIIHRHHSNLHRISFQNYAIFHRFWAFDVGKIYFEKCNFPFNILNRPNSKYEKRYTHMLPGNEEIRKVRSFLHSKILN